MRQIEKRVERMEHHTERPGPMAIIDTVRLPDGRTFEDGVSVAGGKYTHAEYEVMKADGTIKPGKEVHIETVMTAHATPGNVAFLRKVAPHLKPEDVFTGGSI